MEEKRRNESINGVVFLGGVFTMQEANKSSSNNIWSPLQEMIKELRKTILLQILPQEKTFEEAKTKHDQLICLGWNMYRQELLEKLYPSKKWKWNTMPKKLQW